jgi:hypothetical protein
MFIEKKKYKKNKEIIIKKKEKYFIKNQPLIKSTNN